MQLSKLENLFYEKLKGNNILIFRIKDVCLLLKINKTKAYNLVKSLKRKDIIKKIGNGFLAFKESNELSIATELNSPSYISFWSALNYYGFSDQMPKKIFLASTKYSREIKGFKYVTISKSKFFGYVKIGEITIAEKEKAIIDSLLFPKYSGGIREIIKCIKAALKEMEIKKLIEYALKVRSKAVLRRLGFILEELRYKENAIEKIGKKIGKGYELLDPNLRRKNNLNKKWLLDINC